MFEIEKFDIKLDTEIIGRNFIYVDEIESTNAALLDSNSKIDNDGSVMLAERQTAGRGRKDRKWYSNKEQNLTFSILLKRKFKEDRIYLLNFAASLAVVHALDNLYQLSASVKWPNDVLASGKKIAGILIESTSSGNRIDKLVIGIGLNVNQVDFHGTYALTPTSVRKEANMVADRERLLSEILNNFEELLIILDYNPQQIIESWKNKCRMLGERITVSDEKVSKSGIFEDVDERGFLILRTDKNQTETITFGDVSLR